MTRDPSIHVTESKLALALEELLDVDYIIDIDYDKLAKQLVDRLKTKTLLNRSITITNDKLEKKAKKLLSSSRGDADLMANIIYNTRKQLKHRGVSQIKPNSRDWASLKELTKLVVEFCNDFNLDKREGFITYVKLSFNAMNSKSGIIPKMVNMFERICNEYESLEIIQSDNNPQLTKRIHDLYNQQIIKKTGMNSDYSKDPRKYSYFVKVREEAIHLGVSPEVYLKSQFDGFEWRNGIPDPVQLIGDKAKERLNRYMYENSIKVNDNRSELSKSDRAARLRELKKSIENGDYND